MDGADVAGAGLAFGGFVGVRGVLGAGGAVGGEVDRLAGGEFGAEDDAGEEGEGGFGLVGGDLVAGVVDAGEGEVGVLSDGTADVAAVDDELGVAGGGEVYLVGLGCEGSDGKRYGFAAEPVADVVRVTVD